MQHGVELYPVGTRLSGERFHLKMSESYFFKNEPQKLEAAIASAEFFFMTSSLMSHSKTKS